jgi:hypothetical protein
LSIVSHLVSSIPTEATQEAYEGAASQVFFVGLANGSLMGSFLLAYIPVTLYGSFLLYDNVRDTGCDPSGSVFDNDKCEPAAVGVFGALFGITFAGAVLPQISSTLEAFTGKKEVFRTTRRLVLCNREAYRFIVSLGRRCEVSCLPCASSNGSKDHQWRRRTPYRSGRKDSGSPAQRVDRPSPEVYH